MELLSMLRTLGALGLVLGMLAGALWIVRRYDLKLPGRITTTRRKRVELVERLSIDPKRSIALIRRDGCEHLILIGPDGHSVIESGIGTDAIAEITESSAPVAAGRPRKPKSPLSFADMLRPAAAVPTPVPAAKRTRKRRTRREFGSSGRWNRAAVREALNA